MDKEKYGKFVVIHELPEKHMKEMGSEVEIALAKIFAKYNVKCKLYRWDKVDELRV